MLFLEKYFEELGQNEFIPAERMQELEAFLDRLEELETPEAVDKAFAPLFSASENARRLAGIYLEATFLENVADMEQEIDENGMDAIRKELGEAAEETEIFPAEEIVGTQKMVQIFANIGKLRGEDALPMTKAFNDAAAKLTAEERNGIALLAKPLLAVAESFAAVNAKPARGKHPKA